ncbi:hypothetical protein WME90_04785 [Sorangium sp. So ce375]|uniref:hypothetical protein n=1 Tax=Sorangium sp. So ce375 TaxID=3133306 RepID=UPI003F5BEBB6
MKAPKDAGISLQAPGVVRGQWTDPVWCATTPEAAKKRIARVEARRAMARHGVEDPRMEALLVQLAGWTEKWAAEERTAEQAGDDVWVRAVPVKGEIDKRRSRLALVGAVLFVLGVLCGVVLAALQLR